MLLILCNCPTAALAEQISHQLLQRRLIACANLLPSVRSIYSWQGKIEQAEEVPLLLKIRQQDYTEVEQAILALHPYQVPEIIALPVESALTSYQNWLYEVTQRD
ncbi:MULTISPECIES: divalent-cation tolerance protein CutA [Rheinheimera]|uniref:Divalent-cation tolerance protein CutA n=1 Tax=Rheinheimera marina TaxID=1774958 RepID=A0ABV9JML4_9GAMM